jgi:1,4-alpha-glucan branching enzyme/maltooligosyltrehalose trehalohydrolase
MVARFHDMPFGARVTPQGVHFRLWAPDCAQVSLCLAQAAEQGEHGQPEHTEHILPMNPCEDGWFEFATAVATAGTRYRFRVSDGLRVPDPASRFNPGDVHAASEVIDPAAFDWKDDGWQGLPWEQAVIYELHVGTFSPGGTFTGVTERLDYIAALGVTAIELMPIADFPGARGWGYDGVLPYAPDSRYGRPEDLKTLIQAAHERGLMVLLDVVYNHFGPEGNYLHAYAKEFFTERHHTPWGAAINFDGPASRNVREFFIHNALYWLQEYRFDGLRLDAVHAIVDDSKPHILTELAQRVKASIGNERRVHLILENDENQARYLGHGGRDDRYVAQWDDDMHHALHVLATGEKDGYYRDYADEPVRLLGRCLTEGFAFQGEPSSYRHDAPRGEASAHLPPQAFIAFLQCHDQIGNRAFGERIAQIASGPAVRAAVAIILLAPAIPMLFMGEEFGATSPFRFFCDFSGELGKAVTQGRRREFARFARFAEQGAQSAIPDPNAEETFLASKLEWSTLDGDAQAAWLAYYRRLLKLRREMIAPRLQGMKGHSGKAEVFEPSMLHVRWRLGDGSMLQLLANLSSREACLPGPEKAVEETIFETMPEASTPGRLPPWGVRWTLQAAGPECSGEASLRETDFKETHEQSA